MTSRVSSVESRGTGCKMEMGLDSFGTVAECGRRKCLRLSFYLEPASDMPILTLEGHDGSGSLKDRLSQAEGTSPFGLQTCFMGSYWLRHTRVRPAGLVPPWPQALPLEILTWLGSYCVDFGIWLNWKPGIRVYINTQELLFLPHTRAYIRLSSYANCKRTVWRESVCIGLCVFTTT